MGKGPDCLGRNRGPYLVKKKGHPRYKTKPNLRVEKCFDCGKTQISLYPVYKLPTGRRLFVCRRCFRLKYEPWGVTRGKR